jgi:4-amino-4-deoxy-L-arabinose transferase-like glycosyltransferase
VIAVGHSLLGHHPLAVRIGAILSGVLLAVAGRALGKDLFGAAAGNRAGIFLALAPVFAGNSFLMTPDTMLIPAWAFAMLFAWRGSRPEAPMAWWLAVGAAVGMGMLSKYTMVLFFAGLGLLWLLSPGNRKRLFLGSVMAGIVALIIFIPVIRWNSQHDWSSFAHQLNHGFRNEHTSLINFQNLADYAAFLIVLVSPVLGLLCFRTAATRMADPRFRFLGAFFWIVVLFFGYSAGKAHIEANWPMTAFVSGLIMVAGDWERYSRAWRKAAVVVLLIADLGAVIGVCLLAFFQQNPAPLWKNPTEIPKLEEFLGAKKLADTVSTEFSKTGADFICVPSYQLFGVLAFYAPELEPLLWLPFQGRQRFPWINDKAWAGKNALNASSPRKEPPYRWLFEELSPVFSPESADRDQMKHTVYFWFGKSYNPSQLYGR